MSFNKALLLPFALLAACGPKPSEVKPAAPPPAISVSISTLAPTVWPDSFDAVGTVRPRVATTLSSQVMATVLDVKVQPGDRVAAGQTLITLDARNLDTAQRQAQSGLSEARNALPETDSAIASAQAQLDLAQSTLRRMKELLDKRSLSPQEFDESSARVKLAQAALAMAQARKRQLNDKVQQAEQAVQQATISRSYSAIKAPFAALVIARRAEPGTLASPGVPLLDLEQQGTYRLEVAVEEARLAKVQRGAAVEVILDALSVPLSGRIAEIVPTVDPASRSFTVKIDLPSNPALRGGLFGRARFPLGERPALAIPRAAVLTQGQLQSVLVEDSGVARSRLITLGPAHGDAVEVLSGLRPGDRLIYPVRPDLTDGSPVVENREVRK
ncbi:MAG: efflux RND transporter periplasmic adaptor subunit [Acidobacteria bacterium]|nr:efflux RND transporter periplasmic adaptor subunit [Acidobacteriota bacterium]